MRRFMLSDEDLDRVLEGIAPSGDSDAEELAAFARAVEGAFAGPPDEATVRRHLVAIAAEARSASAAATAGVFAETPGRVPKPRGSLRGARGRVARTGLALGAMMLCTAGLAVAGVRLPEPAVSVLEDLGVGLPNQSDTGESGGDTGEDGGARGRDRRRDVGEGGTGSGSVAPSTSAPAGGADRSRKPQAVGGGAPVAPGSPERSGADGRGGFGGRPEDARPPQGRTPDAGPPPQRGGPPPGRGDAPPDTGGPPTGAGGPPSGSGGPPAESPSGPPAGTAPPDATPFGGPSPRGDIENQGRPPEQVAGWPG